VRATRLFVAVASLLVFGGSGLAWSQVHNLQNGLTTADVIDQGNSPPSAEQNILLVGLDTRTDAQGNPIPQSVLDQLHAGSSSDGGDNTDTMIVIHIPAGGGSASAFSIPRDSYVQLAGGYGKHKINSAYTYAQVAATNRLSAQGVSGAQLSVQAAQAGAKNAIQTVEQFTGLTITHFASVNLVGFYNISEAVGGVPVCLKAAVHDSYSGANFPAGPQTVSGTTALEFVRQRHGLPNGDLDRIKRQQAFMASLAKTVLSSGTLTDSTKLTNLIDAVKKTVTLDQGWDVLSFAQQMQSMSSGKIAFQTIPVISIALNTPSDGSAVEVDPNQVQAFINAAINPPAAGSAPSPQTNAGSAPKPAGGQGSSNVTVGVSNASGVDGLAAKVEKGLTDQGFGAGTVSTITVRHTSAVHYAAGEQAAANTVAGILGGGISTVADSSLAAGHVRVYLGTDYTGLGTQDTGAQTSAPAATPQAPSPAPGAITANGVTCIN
jgi:LCP family protein required for cell wall assembly